MNIENIVELKNPTFSEILAQLPAWLLYSFPTQIFFLWVIVEKEYMEHDMKKIGRIVS